MKKIYQVFISSTYEDLKEERQAAIATLLEIGCIPVGMEQFPASSLSQWDYIKKMIDISDYYVLIVAGRYGSIDPDEKISYTEKEYNYAVKKNIPILTFLHNDLNSIPAGKVWKDDNEKLNVERFHMQLKQGRLVKFYSNIGDLKSSIYSAISQATKDTPRIGWVRADQVGGKTWNSLKEIKEQLDSIRNTISDEIDKIVPKYEFATDEDIDALFFSDK